MIGLYKILGRQPRPLALCLFSLAFALLVGCGGPRTLRLDETRYPRRPSVFPVEVWGGGEVPQEHREIAVIESNAYPYDDAETRRQQLEELKKRVRELGGDAVKDVRILAKHVRGYTFDERVPFPAWKQGRYPLFFMRGTAIIYESSLPGSVAEGKGFETPAFEEEEGDAPAFVPPQSRDAFSEEPSDEEPVKVKIVE